MTGFLAGLFDRHRGKREPSRLRRFGRAVVDGLADWIDRDPGRRADEGKP